jgi:hypothetical protein
MQPKLSKNLKEQFACFLENHPPQLFSIFLRNMLLEYIREHVKTGFHLHFDRFLWSMEDLFELLDNAAKEQQEYLSRQNFPLTGNMDEKHNYQQ